MTDLIGRTLGHYRIVEKIGAGGMGEVYRAADERLGRDVAIKTILGSVAGDEQRMGRFEREARLLASLNHQSIATLHGLEEDEGQRFLVMELAEGTTLANRIALRPIPIDEALDYACQIAEGLEAAHEKGIIHRDLKPANVMLSSQGEIKILDFGLAKAFEQPGSDPSNPESIADSPTLTAAMTGTGVLLGTAAYMSPEQARGKQADKRADVWAFGCVLYEMLTGRKAFEGDDSSQTMAAILRDEPDWSALPAATPNAVRRLLNRCLTKDPRDRLHDIADARIELVNLPIDDNGGGLAEASLRNRKGLPTWLPWGLVALSAPLVIAGVIGLFRTDPPRAVKNALVGVEPASWLGSGRSGGPEFESSRLSRTAMALSPDGLFMVFSAGKDEDSRLYLRAMDEISASPIIGTEGGMSPFFSPDGEWIGFWANGSLKKVRTDGGPPMSVCAVPSPPCGASWGPGGTIVVGQMRGPVLEVSADGGAPEEVTSLAAGESGHRHPQLLAGGDTLLFTVVKREKSRNSNDTRIVAQSLKTGKRTALVENGADPRYAETGHLIFCRLGSLVAVPFDPMRLKITGGSVIVRESVRQGINAANLNWDSHSGQFSVSSSGTLVYVPGGIWPDGQSSLLRVDRQGHEELLPVPPRPYSGVRYSPDGTRVAIAMWHQGIWVYEISRGTLTPITTGGTSDFWPLWTPDGTQLTFSSDRIGGFGIYQIPADGSGSAERLLSTEGTKPASWSPDGQVLAFLQNTEAGDRDIRMPPRDGEPDRDIWMLPHGGEPEPFIESSFSELYPTFSPDGRWLAYVSDQSGGNQVYVTPYPGPGPRVQVSVDAGSSPCWAPDGRELFFLNLSAYDEGTISMWAVDVTTGRDFEAGRPRMLFKSNYQNFIPIRGYDVAPDGRAFLFISKSSSPEQSVTHLNVTFNFFDELKQLVPAN